MSTPGFGAGAANTVAVMANIIMMTSASDKIFFIAENLQNDLLILEQRCSVFRLIANAQRG